jgi:hypothetical protein
VRLLPAGISTIAYAASVGADADTSRVTVVTCHSVRMSLARWDPDAVARLEYAGVKIFGAPKEPIVK